MASGVPALIPLPAHVAPEWERGGLPLCAEAACPSYETTLIGRSGRGLCGVTGILVDEICAPAVVEMASVIRRSQRAAKGER